MIREGLLILSVVAALGAGCAKKNAETSPAPSGSPATAASPAGTAAASPGGAQTAAPSGGAATAPGATAAPGGTANNGAAQQPPPAITFQQFQSIKLNTKRDEVTKALGSEGQIVADEPNKLTVEYKIKDEADLYGRLVFTGGILTEASSYKKGT